MTYRVLPRWRNAFLAASVAAFPLLAQDPVPAPRDADEPGGWRRVDEPRSRDRQDDRRLDDRRSDDRRADDRRDDPPARHEPAPDRLVLNSGAWITVRVDQMLSSDRNYSGDRFTATLAQPLVVDGYVVARRGQTLEGRVAEAVKAGRAKGTSRLGVELIELSLVDGQRLPVRTQLAEYAAGTSVGRDVAASGTVVGTGAAIGAAAGGGPGAAIGAGAGAVAAAIGVLSTRGKATVVYPEAVLSFRTQENLTIRTERSLHAFQPVRQEDYEPRLNRRNAPDRETVYVGGPSWGWGPGWGPGWGWGGGWGRGWYAPRYYYGGARFYPFGGRGYGGFGGYRGRGRR